MKLNKFSCIYAFLSLLFYTSWGSAQQAVRLQQISLDEGLSQAEVRVILQDHEGFLWFGTQQGLNLYDAYRIRTISGPQRLLEIQQTDTLFQDSQQRIWIGSAPNRNFILDKANNQITEIKPQYPKDHEVIDSAFQSIVEDPSQNLWLATYWEVFFYDNQSAEFSYLLSLREQMGRGQIIRSLLLYEDHLIIAVSNGLYVLNTQSHELTQLPLAASITKIQPDTPIEENDDRLNVKGLYVNQQNNILLATVEGLFQVTPDNLKQAIEQSAQSFELELLTPSLNIWKVIEKPDYYWLATHDGLYQLFKTGQLIHHFRYSDTSFHSADNNIITMIEDLEGNLWFGSRNDGAFKWKPILDRFNYYQQNMGKQSLSNNRIWAAKEDTRGNLWIGTRNGLNRINQATGEVESFLVNPDPKATVSESTIHDIEIQGDRLWIATATGVRIFNASTLSEESPVLNEDIQKVFSSSVADLHFNSDNELMVLNRDGIHTYNTDTNSYSFNENARTDGKITKILTKVFTSDKRDDDKLLMGMADRIALYSKSQGTYTTFHSLPPADEPRTWASAVYQGENYTWVAYPGFGIYLLDKNTGEEIRHFTSIDGLPDNSPLDIHGDDDGYVWVTSNSGLIRFDPATLHFRIFDTSDGLSTNEFNGGATTVTKDGKFVLGSIKGVMTFDPAQLNRIPSNRAIENHITKISLMSRELPQNYSVLKDYELDLFHTDYGLRVEFSALMFSNPKKVKYKYWIEGSSEISPKTILDTELFLPKLEAGTNTVKISAIDYETGEESVAEQFTLHVYPPPYLSWWAYTLYTLVIGGLLFSVYFQKHQRQKVLVASNQNLRESEERLQLALSGSDSDLWDWQSRTNLIYEPRLAGHVSDSKLSVSFEEKLNFIHPEDREKFLIKWNSFVDGNNEVFDVVYRMKSVEGNWHWYRDMARVASHDSKGQPERVTGTFTDISNQKNTRDKMFLYFEAFENTRDIIVILDHSYEVIAANRALYNVTGLSEFDIINKPVSFLSKPNSDIGFAESLVKAMHDQTHCESEGLIERKYQSPLNVLISATRFDNEDSETHYVLAITDISEQKAYQEKLKHLANYDSLTGLPNRALVLDRITHAIDLCQRRSQKLCLFFIDLDRFKQVNDTLGHEAGDTLLKEVANILKSSVRKTDTVARLGGDEFVVMLEDFKSINIIQKIAKSIIDKMSHSIKLGDNEVTVSPSIGISIYPDDGDIPEDLIKHADIAMYHAKNSGRNNYKFFEASMNQEAHQRMSLENQLRRAIKDREFYLMYQPQVDISTGRIQGFEALARWKLADGTVIPPSDFIPIAEELGLIVPMTEQFIEESLENIKQWQEKQFNGGISINISARHLQNSELLTFVEKAISNYSIAPGLIEFEVTESILMSDIQASIPLMKSINDLGIHFSLDDFGTGYSSLKYLHQLPIKKLKIDRSFVWKIGEHAESEAIIETILSLSRSLQLKTVVEGVETEQQLDFVKKLGADYVQGYYYSKPVTLDEAIELFSKTYTV